MGNLTTGNVKFTKNTDVTSKNEKSGLSDVIIHIGVVEALDEDPSTGRLKVRVQDLDKGKGTTPTFCNEKIREGTKSKRLVKKVGSTEIGSITMDSPIGKNDNKIKNNSVKSLSNQNCNELPWATPLLPLHLQIRPKLNEYVMVFVHIRDNGKMDRSWIGPIAPDYEYLNFSNDKIAKAAMNSALIKSTPKKDYTLTKNIYDGIDVKKRGDFTGIFPERNDISLMSRNNADIILPSLNDKKNEITKSGEVILRAGKFKINEFKINDENIAYFRLCYLLIILVLFHMLMVKKVPHQT
jgi:hypothetical protein